MERIEWAVAFTTLLIALVSNLSKLKAFDIFSKKKKALFYLIDANNWVSVSEAFSSFSVFFAFRLSKQEIYSSKSVVLVVDFNSLSESEIKFLKLMLILLFRIGLIFFRSLYYLITL